jgi:GABA(A) receptor-associated protein
MYVIRKRLRLPSEDAIFLFVGEDKVILPIHMTIYEAFYRFKNKDGFLYIVYSKENVFG